MKVLFLSVLWALRVSARSREDYDYVIVGSGSAGMAVANQLSARPDIRVLLLEAGGRSNLLTEVPAYYPSLQFSQLDWNYTVQLPWFSDLGVEREPAHLPQGKVVGGTSLLNSMMYVRGNRKDFDNWEKKGAKSWSWWDVFPYFLRSENNRNPEIAGNGYHSSDGELYVQYPATVTPLAEIYLKAAKEKGFYVGDVNGFNQSVFANPQITTRDGRRWGVDKAFLHPIEGRRNFRIIPYAFVRKVLIGQDNVAIGVEYEYRGRIRRVFVKEEVIVCAGTIRSPQLLMMSGIGPARELKDFGISVVSDLPVGENFQDQPLITTPLFEFKNISMSDEDVKLFFNDGTGLLAYLPTEAFGFYSSKYSEDPQWPDSEVIFVTFVKSSLIQERDGSVLCINLAERPKSRGKITLNSIDPHVPPIIDGKYISEESDLKVLVEGIKMCLSLADAPSMKSIGKRIELPEFESCQKYSAQSDDYYACVVKHSVSPSYHVVGTCKMGDPKDPSTVVDPTLKVKGVKNLRVADASVIPEIMVGHPHAATIMIGERAADMILADYEKELRK